MSSALLDLVQIGAERRLQLRKFSKGMIQRVGLAQALINDPEVVFLDEPMSGLDPLGRREVRSLILRLRDEGRTVFFSSHILSDAETLCSRVAILAKGRLLATGRLADMLAFRAQGWDAVVEGLAPESLARAWCRRGPSRAHRRRAVRDRVHRRSPASRHRRGRSARPVAGCCRSSPVRETLEDFFVKQVQDADLGSLRSRGTAAVARSIGWRRCPSVRASPSASSASR